ncbi:MAG: hypothetical protein Q4F41_01085 [Eubacteriales bacterium]|nr:hypothetical protein [Eubacteriales bacterium]
MKKKTAILCILLLCMFLTGCAGRELEDRKFPTVVTFPDEKPWELQEKRQKSSSKFLDYGQVKAIVLEDTAAQNPERLEEILKYLAETPAFARNLLVFQGDEAILAVFGKELEDQSARAGEKESEKETDEAEEADGTYLEDLYKNQPKEYEMSPVTLKELLNSYYNEEAGVKIPTLAVRDGKIQTDAYFPED